MLPYLSFLPICNMPNRYCSAVLTSAEPISHCRGAPLQGFVVRTRHASEGSLKFDDVRSLLEVDSYCVKGCCCIVMNRVTSDCGGFAENCTAC